MKVCRECNEQTLWCHQTCLRYEAEKKAVKEAKEARRIEKLKEAAIQNNIKGG